MTKCDSLQEDSRSFSKKLTCLFLCFISFLFSLSQSSSDIGLTEAVQILLASMRGVELTSSLETAKIILFDVRLPRVLLVTLCGGSLAVAGVLSQGLFRNPLASPSLVGASSGALLGGALCFFLGAAFDHVLSLSLFALLGSFFSTGLLLLLYTRFQVENITKLLLVGLSFSTLASAVCSLLISLEDRDPYRAAALYRWFLGGFYHSSWDLFFLGLVPLSLGSFFCFRSSGELDVLSLGDESALSLGLNLSRFKFLCLFALSLILGVVTSLGGAIPFVGLVVPHITRSLIGPHHKDLMAYSFINGMSLMLLADLVAKKALAHKELELSLVLSLLGAPFFLFLLIRKEGR